MNFTKKHFALGLVVSTLAFQSAVANPFKGVYVGVNAGASNMASKLENESTDNTAGAANENWKSNKKKNVFQANVLVGKEVYRINGDMPLCAEFSFGTTFGGFKPKVANAGGDDRAAKVRQTWKLGLHALLGKKITDRMSVAAKLGVVYSNFRVTERFTNNALFQAPFDNGGSLNKDYKLFGIEPGVRLSFDVNECVCAHLEGTYTLFQGKKQTFFEQNNGTPGQNERMAAKITPRIFGLVAGVTYKF